MVYRKYKSSLVAAAIIYQARILNQIEEKWSKELQILTSYSLKDLEEILSDFQENIGGDWRIQEVAQKQVDKENQKTAIRPSISQLKQLSKSTDQHKKKSVSPPLQSMMTQ